jgi:hypothetical protein
LARLFLAFALGAGLGFDFFRRLQPRTAEGTEEQRMVYERTLIFIESDKADSQENDSVGTNRDARLEIAAVKSFFQLLAAASERLLGFYHEFSLRRFRTDLSDETATAIIMRSQVGGN